MGLPWDEGTRAVFESNMPAIEEVDRGTGLKPFMLAACGTESDLEGVFNLLRENPVACIKREWIVGGEGREDGRKWIVIDDDQKWRFERIRESIIMTMNKEESTIRKKSHKE